MSGPGDRHSQGLALQRLRAFLGRRGKRPLRPGELIQPGDVLSADGVWSRPEGLQALVINAHALRAASEGQARGLSHTALPAGALRRRGFCGGFVDYDVRQRSAWCRRCGVYWTDLLIVEHRDRLEEIALAEVRVRILEERIEAHETVIAWRCRGSELLPAEEARRSSASSRIRDAARRASDRLEAGAWGRAFAQELREREISSEIDEALALDTAEAGDEPGEILADPPGWLRPNRPR